MSGGSKAAFLSYASQDAEAAQRICDALRAAGVEVWFDRSELVGGDAWDQKIRKQIGSCALFMPIVSANTQARAEGYFRLEWRLADQRTHLMGKSKAFLLPVCIDDTRDSEADVPDSFLAVQWTRFKGGEPSPAFVARVQKLLAGGAGPVSDRPPAPPLAENVQRPARPQRSRYRWLVPAVIAIAVAITIVAYLGRHPAPDPGPDYTEPVAASTAPMQHSAARRLAQQAWDLALAASRDSHAMASATEMAAKAIELDSLDGNVWAYAAYVDLHARILGLDPSEARVTQIRTKVARAKSLAQRSPEVRIAEALMLTELDSHIPGRLSEAERILRELQSENLDRPTAAIVAGNLGSVLRKHGHHEEAARMMERAGESNAGWMNAASWSFLLAGKFNEALRVAERQRLMDTDGGLEQLAVIHWYAGDLEASVAALDQMSDAARRTERVVLRYALLACRKRDWEGAIAAMSQIAGDFVENRAFDGPKRLITGCAHFYAGRTEAARAEWQTALRSVEQRLATEGNSGSLLFNQWELLTRLGRSAEAAQSARLMQQLGVMKPGEEPAIFFALQQDREGTLRAARRSIDNPGGIDGMSYAMLRYRAEFDFMRDDPRWQQLLRDSLLPGMKPLDEPKPRTPDLRPANSPLADAKSVAVLAFANLSDDKANEYFSDGISEELLNVLAKVPGLKVSARTSAFFFKGKEVPIPEIAKQLGVAYVVEGSVRKQGDKVRITAQLIKAADGFHVWSDTFTRDLKDIFAVQDEIAGLVAQNLQLKMDLAPAKRAVNPEAHRLVLEGRHFWLQRTDEAFARAQELYAKALEIDPDFADAHAGIADVFVVRGWYHALSGASVTAADFTRAREEANIALRLDPTRPEPHASLAAVNYNEGRFAEAELAFKEALRLNPNYAVALHWRSHLLMAQGRLDEALASIERSIELDPFSSITLVIYASWLEYAGRNAEAVAVTGRAMALRTDEFIPLFGTRALALWNIGRRDEAVAAARVVTRDPKQEPRWWVDGGIVHVLREAGLTAEANAHAEMMLVELHEGSTARAGIFAGLGESERALAELAKPQRRPAGPGETFYTSPWAAARRDPRYKTLMIELGRAEEYRRAQETVARMEADRK